MTNENQWVKLTGRQIFDSTYLSNNLSYSKTKWTILEKQWNSLLLGVKEEPKDYFSGM